MENDSNEMSPMSDAMVVDLLNNILKDVDGDDESTSPVDQRTDEDGTTQAGDGLTSGSDAKRGDGFSSPRTFPPGSSNGGFSVHGAPTNGNISSFDDDEGSGSNSSNNPSGDVYSWAPSAAAPVKSVNALPGCMFPPGYERKGGSTHRQTSSEDSDEAEKVSSRHVGLRSPHNSGSRGTHPTPRAGLNVLRNTGEITQQWPPHADASATAALQRERRVANDPAPPAYLPATAASGLGGATTGTHQMISQHSTQLFTMSTPYASAPSSHSSPPLASQVPMSTPASRAALPPRNSAATPPTTAKAASTPPTLADGQFFAVPRGENGGMPPPYTRHATTGAPNGRSPLPVSTPTTATSPYATAFSQSGWAAQQQPPMQQSSPAAYNQREPTVMLTVSQLNALLQQQQQSTPYTTMPSQTSAFSPGIAYPGPYPPAMQSAGTNPLYMVFGSPQNTGATPSSASPFQVSGMRDGLNTYQNAHNGMHSQFLAPADRAAVPKPASGTPDTEMWVNGSPSAHRDGHKGPPPQYQNAAHGGSANCSPAYVLRTHNVLNDGHAAVPAKPNEAISQLNQTLETGNLPQPPWQLPTRTTTSRGQNGGGGGSGGVSQQSTSPFSHSPVQAWVRRNGRWSPLELEIA